MVKYKITSCQSRSGEATRKPYPLREGSNLFLVSSSSFCINWKTHLPSSSCRHSQVMLRLNMFINFQSYCKSSSVGSIYGPPPICSLTDTNDLLAHLVILPTRHTGSSFCAVLAYDFWRRSQQNGALRASVILHKQGTFTCLYASPAFLRRLRSCFFFLRVLIFCATWRLAASSCFALIFS